MDAKAERKEGIVQEHDRSVYAMKGGDEVRQAAAIYLSDVITGSMRLCVRHSPSLRGVGE